MSSQLPCSLAFLWPRQIKGSTYHVPDFFVRLSNGHGRIVDVKRLAAVNIAISEEPRTTHQVDGWVHLSGR